MAAQLTKMDNVKVPFSEPKDSTINDIEYKHINIKTKYSDGTIGPLIIPLKGCYSFGLQKNENYGNYSMPIVVKEEFVKVFKSFTNQCKKHLVKVADEIGKDGMELSDLKNFGSCFCKRDDKSSVLYSKIIYDSNTDRIITDFYEKEKIDDPEEFGMLSSDPLKYLKKKCNVNAPIKFESIFI